MTFKFYTYILKCSDGRLYTGYTNDLEKRIAKHNSGKGAKFTRGRGPVELMFFEECPSKEHAMTREAEIKRLTRKDKLQIIKGDKEMTGNNKKGTLYLCATPIGNLEDITLRALRILKEVSLIAAEDTRHTRKLLSYYDIHTPLTSYYEHNAKGKGQVLLSDLNAGKDVALVSDAGTPGISDPGYELVCLALSEGFMVVPIPGPTALITAVLCSGLPIDRFVFEGFLPRVKKERNKVFEQMKSEERTQVFYESPRRVIKTLQEMQKLLGERKVAVARELTKIHEEVVRGLLADVISYFQANPPKGEFVIVLEGSEENPKDCSALKSCDLFLMVNNLVTQGWDKKEAIKEVARRTGIGKNNVYAAVLEAEGK
ncbi:16S rRNA (cytidine(1402)-2'-O)-methyltransferase [Phosphitispora sp. TUW77]|uniref:16S rRNA (cytidine(1402)-2'-O)-methyltransferase n=1 Tax=Phosphitispora sp. TUW77 TaxID=3152361 RepID=UPI003AB4389B